MYVRPDGLALANHTGALAVERTPDEQRPLDGMRVGDVSIDEGVLRESVDQRGEDDVSAGVALYIRPRNE